MKKRILAVCLVCAILLAGCSVKKDGQNHNPQPTEDGPTSPSDQTTVPLDGQLEYITVETRYGELRYQEQWRDLIQVDVTDQDDVTNVVFKTLLNNTVVRLFQVTIGGDEDGAIGMLTGADGVSRNVYIVPFEQMDTSGLSEDEQNRLHAMFEEINYIVENLT